MPPRRDRSLTCPRPQAPRADCHPSRSPDRIRQHKAVLLVRAASAAARTWRLRARTGLSPFPTVMAMMLCLLLTSACTAQVSGYESPLAHDYGPLTWQPLTAV